MRAFLRVGVRVLVLVVVGVAMLSHSRAGAATRYVCPPCGAMCDTLTFAAAGVCPLCGMTLVEASAVAAAATKHPAPKKVAFLVFNACEILDFSGPYEMFGAAGCDVYTVAATKDPVTTAMGLTVVPKYSFADAPPPDVLVIPGGGVKQASEDKATLEYIKTVTAHDQSTMSVCNGAFILANTGLLDGLSATTTNGNIPRLRSQYPKIKVVGDQRYVDNGKLITTAGLSAGMDGALHVIAKLFGTGYAQAVALGEEYAWQPTGGFVRAALADHQIPETGLDELGDWHVVRMEGDRRHWDVAVNGKPKLSASECMHHLERALMKGKWTKVGTAGANSASRRSTWKFTGSDGKPWTGTLKVEGDGSAGGVVTAEIQIARVG